MAIRYSGSAPTSGKYGSSAITAIKYGSGTYKFIDTMTGSQAVSPVTATIYEGWNLSGLNINKTLASINANAPTRVSGSFTVTIVKKGNTNAHINSGYIYIGGIAINAEFHSHAEHPETNIKTFNVSGVISNRNITCNVTLGGNYHGIISADFSGLTFS